MPGKTVFSLLAGALVLTIAASVSARQNAGPCSEDVAKLCEGVQAGAGRMAQCLKQHENELSPACRAHAMAAKEKIHDFADACREDTARLCKGTRPGGGRLLQCLRQHEGELSAGCKDRMQQAKNNSALP